MSEYITVPRAMARAPRAMPRDVTHAPGVEIAQAVDMALV
jgi:hypothetical protein